MSPSTKPQRNLKVNVPRHNSQRIGPLLTANVEAVAREDGTRVDVSQTAFEPTSALAQAIESASEWNSLLMTARADRGPQWDVGTQLFQVDEGSELYYDPTPLTGYLKDQQHPDEPPAANSASHRQQQLQHDAINSPRIHRTSSIPQGGMTPALSQAQLYGTPQAMASPRHFPGAPGGFVGGMGGPIPPAQFYGTGGDGMPASPMQRAPGMGMSPAMGMSPGMGMNPGMGMMAPDGTMSPEVRRRVTRGMSMDEFGNMHG
ncbi:hypothetical protein LXA43DRAFT_982857 [Ganoderma leucocontextum]|nr:hypothetical protein LXA43DRAFT_982857 [Ganoderma leucocontextum]